MSNISEGHRFELDFCQELAEHGWWVHNLATSASGQPADVIAIKFGRMALIDCKVLSTKRGFPLSRIEDNQHMAMTRFTERTNGFGWFAIRDFRGTVWMIRYAQMKKCQDEGMKSIPQDDFPSYGLRLDTWLEGW